MIRVVVNLLKDKLLIHQVPEGKIEKKHTQQNKTSIVLSEHAFGDLKNKVDITCYLNKSKTCFIGYMPKEKYKLLELRR